MQGPRLTPRNIQFQDSVQIREIPSYGFELQPTPYPPVQEPPWDPNPFPVAEEFEPKPPNPKYVVTGFVVGGLILVAAIIGTVLALALAQKTTTASDNSLTYNAACKTGSNQCMSSQGLSCSNGFCTCSSPYSWNTAASSCTTLTYYQACTAAAQCNSLLGLNCTNSLCQCDSYHTWNSANNTCIVILNNTLSYGVTCINGSSQCSGSAGLVCTGNCSCVSPKIWNVSNCVCPAGTFLNSSNFCQTAYSVNHSCTVGSNQCDSTKNLLCNSSVCQCDYSTRYWDLNYQTCLVRIAYGQFCTHDGDCLPTLICPTMPGVCSCPTYLPDLVCNCDNTKYYSSSLSQCVSRSTYGGSCLTSANYTCLATLYCNSNTCACRTGMTWLAANSSCVTSG